VRESAYTSTTGSLYQSQNKIFLAPVIRVFSYIAVAEQAGFVRFLSGRNTLTEPCGLSFRELHRLDDDDLMEHLRLSHDEALTVLFDRYHRLVLSIAAGRTRTSRPGFSERADRAS
jgi:hypothetical protein